MNKKTTVESKEYIAILDSEDQVFGFVNLSGKYKGMDLESACEALVAKGLRAEVRDPSDREVPQKVSL